MKIKCEGLIVDQADYLSHKGHLIPDKKWFNFWDDIDSAIEDSGEKNPEDSCMQLRIDNRSKLFWECNSCGRLFVDSVNGELIIFMPENLKYNGVLDNND